MQYSLNDKFSTEIRNLMKSYNNIQADKLVELKENLNDIKTVMVENIGNEFFYLV